MQYFSTIIIFISFLFSEYDIDGRWHLVGYEDAIMYQFVDTEPFANAGLRYSIYVDDNGEFDDLDGGNIGGTPHPYSIEGDIITIDAHFGNIVSYHMNYRCDGQVVDFVSIPGEVIHSTLFKEGYSYSNNTCEEYGDINNDGQINVIDVVLLVSNILDEIVNGNGDINQDGSLNIIDVVLLVDIILNQEIIPESGLFISQQYQENELTFFYDLEYSQRPNPYGVQYSSSRTQQEEQLQDTIFLHLDLVLPPNPENKLLPMVVMIHGGGFHGGNKEQKLHYAQDYATLGYIGCTINYRLTRQNIIQESDEYYIAAVNDAIEDAMNAIRYLKNQSSLYNIDNNRIVTIGNSAGAFISLHNAIDNDESLPDQESINDYPGISSLVSASVSTGAIFPNEGLISLNFDEDDASCLIMHAEDYDQVTDTYWEDDVLPFYEAIINSGNYAALVAQPSGSHGVGVGPFEEYSDDIIPFIWEQLNLFNW